MIRKLFLYLLKKYTKDERGRLMVLSKIEDGVIKTYYEQTPPGNVYNGFGEFVMSNKYIKERVKENDVKSIMMMRNGIMNEYDRQIKFMSKYRMRCDDKKAKLFKRKFTINNILNNE